LESKLGLNPKLELKLDFETEVAAESQMKLELKSKL
jgi:hypothetical protein